MFVISHSTNFENKLNDIWAKQWSRYVILCFLFTYRGPSGDKVTAIFSGHEN